MAIIVHGILVEVIAKKGTAGIITINQHATMHKE
jgi:hypothetical protein